MNLKNKQTKHKTETSALKLLLNIFPLRPLQSTETPSVPQFFPVYPHRGDPASFWAAIFPSFSSLPQEPPPVPPAGPPTAFLSWSAASHGSLH